MPAFLNGANEAAVALFLDGKIGFLDIANVIEKAMSGYNTVYDYTLKDVLKADSLARDAILNIVGR